MGHGERRAGERVAIGLRVRLRYRTLDELVERFAVNVSRGGFFVRTRDPKPVGTEILFELLLAGGERAVRGRGVVRWISPPEAVPRAAPGMGIEFTALDPASREIVERMLAARGDKGPAQTPVLTRTVAPPSDSTPNGNANSTANANANSNSTSTPTKAKRAPAQADLSAAHPIQRLSAGPIGLDLGLPSTPAPLGPPSGVIIGIDLGTTNSCAAMVKDGRPYVVPSREGYNTVPSVVAVNARNRVVVGHLAKTQLLSNPRDTVFGAKRLVGRPFDSSAIQHIREAFPYDIVEGEDGMAAVRVAGHRLALEQVSALVLREVKEVAQNHLGAPVNRAVITVPAYYTERQRDAVRRAGALAGLHVERIVNEPTAAAIAYAYGRAVRERVLVYDLGGGTFDASVLELQENVYEVVSTGGDTFLGGVDFDHRIVAKLLERYEAQSGRPFDGDRVALSRLVDAAERAKCALSERQDFRIQLPFLATRDGAPIDFDVTLKRAEIVELVTPLVDRTLEVCRAVLAEKKLTPQDLDAVILVGGQSRMPLVHERVRAFFGRAPSRAVHPDEAVAIGAALLAHSLGSAEGVVLIDVLPLSIAIVLPDGRTRPLFDRNTPLPARKRQTLSTEEDGQTAIELRVVQGEAPAESGAEHLGTVRLEGLPAGPRGMVKVGVTFELGSEGLLAVSAREVQTDRPLHATFTAGGRRGTRRDEVRARPMPAWRAAAPQPQPRGVGGFFRRLLRGEAR